MTRSIVASSARYEIVLGLSFYVVCLRGTYLDEDEDGEKGKVDCLRSRHIFRNANSSSHLHHRRRKLQMYRIRQDLSGAQMLKHVWVDDTSQMTTAISRNTMSASSARSQSRLRQGCTCGGLIRRVSEVMVACVGGCFPYPRGQREALCMKLLRLGGKLETPPFDVINNQCCLCGPTGPTFPYVHIVVTYLVVMCKHGLE